MTKDGRTDRENDDRAAAGLRRFAVADGATDSGRAGTWAEILVSEYVRAWPAPVSVFEPRELDKLREYWQREVYRADLPWHATWKLDTQPGAAAFAGVEVDVLSGSYLAMAVGDCCFLHVRGRELVYTGPVDDWKDFGSHPSLVRVLRHEESLHSSLWRYEGTYEPGDILILATDALAKYLLRRHERTGKVDIDDCALDSDHAFADWVAEVRAKRELDNDDTTICVVTL